MDDRDERSGGPGGNDADPADTELGKRGYSQTGEDEGQSEHADDASGGQVASQLDLKSGEPKATDD